MDNVKIEIDFIPAFFKADRKNQKRLAQKENGFCPEMVGEGSNFIDNLVNKISDQDEKDIAAGKNKKANSSVTALNLLVNKEKQDISQTAENSKNSGFNVSPERLQESSQIVDEILETLKSKS